MKRRIEKLQSTPAVVDSKEATKKEECEELSLVKEQFAHRMDVLQNELIMMHKRNEELMEE